MWRDIGLYEWLFDFEQPDGADGLTEAVLQMVTDPASAKAKVEKAKRYVNKRQKETMAELAKCLTTIDE